MSLSPQQQLRLRTLDTDLCTVEEMAADLGVDKQTILQELSVLGIKPRLERDKPEKSEFSTHKEIAPKSTPKTNWTDEMTNRLIELYRQGETTSAIASALKLEYGIVYAKINHLKKTGKLEIQEQAEPAPVVTPAPLPAPTIKVPAFVLKVIEKRVSLLDSKIEAELSERAELLEFLNRHKNEPSPTAIDESSNANLSPKL